MAIPGKFAVYGDAKVPCLRGFLQLLAVDGIRGLYDVALVGDPDDLSGLNSICNPVPTLGADQGRSATTLRLDGL